MPLLQIAIDLSGITQTSFSNPFAAMFFLFVQGGWLIAVVVILWGFWQARLVYIQNKYEAKMKHIFLAIDVPKLNEVSPKAAEQIFAHLSGIQKRGNLIERYIHGYTQPGISLELVSIGGYIQFIIRTPVQFRDMVEAAVYAQYPDAEISEIEDYVPVIKPEFPNEYDLWGSEIAFTNKNVYPIRTFPFFEHTLTQKFIDPMASILEIMSRLRAGEQIWLQWIIEPAGDEWRHQGERTIKKLIGAKVKEGGGLLQMPGKIGTGVYETLTASLLTPSESSQNNRELPSLMQHLPPNERAVVEGVGMKIAKIGYVTKCRLVYFANREVFDKSRVPAVVGSLKQFNTLDLNGFRVDKKTKTAVDYFFVKSRIKSRKRRIYYGFRYRSLRRGQRKLILNIEELASVYHFPVVEVKAPLVKKTESKKGEPPSSLPVVMMPAEPTEEGATNA